MKKTALNGQKTLHHAKYSDVKTAGIWETDSSQDTEILKAG